MTIASKVKAAPITSLGVVEAVVLAVLSQLTAHNVIHVDSATVVDVWFPVLAVAWPVLWGALKWRLVSPFAKVKATLEKDGLLTDADLARLEALIEEKLGLVEPEPEPAQVPLPGMSAGAPSQ